MARPSRFVPLLLTAGAVLACETTGSGLLIGGGTSGGAPSNSQRTELVLALEDEVEAVLTSLTLATPGVPPGYATAGCPAVGASLDADIDGIPDDQTRTFTNPPCTIAGFDGGTSFAITGTVQIEDTAQTDTTSFRLTETAHAWKFLDAGAGTETDTATWDGTRSRQGTDSSVTLASNLTVVRNRPSRANTTITLLTTATFTSDSDTVKVGSALPSGTFKYTGTMTWHRSTENWNIALDTPVPLAFDPTCTTTPLRIKSGKLTLTGTISGAAGVLTLTFSACGTDPATQWTPSP